MAYENRTLRVLCAAGGWNGFLYYYINVSKMSVDKRAGRTQGSRPYGRRAARNRTLRDGVSPKLRSYEVLMIP